MDAPVQSLGYRGYIASRAVRGVVTPQHVQNLVIRDYADRNGLAFKLSATEYAMEACYMMLEAVLEDIENLDGIICYSLFMLPKQARRRHAIYRRAIGSGRTLHGALENMKITSPRDIARFEDIMLVDQFAAAIAPQF